jgi:hypothetical protein
VKTLLAWIPKHVLLLGLIAVLATSIGALVIVVGHQYRLNVAWTSGKVEIEPAKAK